MGYLWPDLSISAFQKYYEHHKFVSKNVEVMYTKGLTKNLEILNVAWL